MTFGKPRPGAKSRSVTGRPMASRLCGRECRSAALSLFVAVELKMKWEIWHAPVPLPCFFPLWQTPCPLMGLQLPGWQQACLHSVPRWRQLPVLPLPSPPQPSLALSFSARNSIKIARPILADRRRPAMIVSGDTAFQTCQLRGFVEVGALEGNLHLGRV